MQFPNAETQVKDGRERDSKRSREMRRGRKPEG